MKKFLAFLALTIATIARATTLGDYQVSQATSVSGSIPTFSTRIVTPSGGNYSLGGFSNATPPVAANFAIGTGLTVGGTFPNLTISASETPGGATWGDITGTLSDQTDLQDALNALAPATPGASGSVLYTVNPAATTTSNLDSVTSTSGNALTLISTSNNVVVTPNPGGSASALHLNFNSLPLASLPGGSITDHELRIDGPSTSGDNARIFLYNYEGNNSSIFLFEAQGSAASPSATLSGDQIATISGNGYSGTSFTGGASFRYYAEGDWTTSSCPTSFDILTTASGSTSQQIKAAVKANGNLVVGTGNSGGIATDNGNGRIQINSTSNTTGIGFNTGATEVIYRSASGILKTDASWTVGGNLIVTGHNTLEGVTSTGATGTGQLVFSAAPTFTGTTSTAAITSSTPSGVNQLALKTFADTSPQILFQSHTQTTGHYNWLIGSQVVTNNTFEIVPSTAINGLTFTSPAIQVLGATGQVNIPTNIASTSTTTGSLVDSGGLGVAGAANIGGPVGINVSDFANTMLTVSGNFSHPFSSSRGYLLQMGGNTYTDSSSTTGTVGLIFGADINGGALAASATGIIYTDAAALLVQPPSASTNVTVTRLHSIGVVDSTSASSSITGAFVVAATLGSSATSVGIGGGNVNAGGSVTSGGAAVVGTTLTVGASGTSLTNVRTGTTGALTGGTITVSDAAATSSTKYFFTTHSLGTVTAPQSYYVSSRSAGTSFTVTSSSALDTSTVDWIGIN